MGDSIPLKDFLAAEVVKLDDNLEAGTPDWCAAMFLLASVFIGCKPDEIARALDLDPSGAHTFAHRARTNGVWKTGPEGETCPTEEWEADEGGGVSFWMDVSCVVGEMTRLPSGEYTMTPKAVRRVSKLLKGHPLSPKDPSP